MISMMARSRAGAASMHRSNRPILVHRRSGRVHETRAGGASAPRARRGVAHGAEHQMANAQKQDKGIKLHKGSNF